MASSVSGQDELNPVLLLWQHEGASWGYLARSGL